MVCMILWFAWICYVLLCMDILVDTFLYYSIIYYSFLSMTKGEKELTIICRNIYIYIYIYKIQTKSQGDHIFRGRFRTSDICCHQSKRGRMLSQDFYRVLISDKGISRDRQKEVIHCFKETQRAPYIRG